MYYRLRPGLHFCLLDGRALFLDIESGRYFAAAGQSAATLARLAAAGGFDEDGLLDVGALVAGALIVPAGEDRTFAPAATVDPLQAAFSAAGDAVGWRGTAMSAARQIAARRMTARMTFAQILSEVSRCRRRDDRGLRRSAHTLEDLAAFHERAGLFLGHADRCLPRSLALLLHAYANGHRPKFVIGVRSHPFAAHCWVQSAGTVLNDNIDHARLFTPILVR
ncbi:MAG: lasso peptide biosynthesis B2 protein [Novosphingobium sp.]|nr:lasso peptide biosynthesis B2 protein [Novosphingobium sp.]